MRKSKKALAEEAALAREADLRAALRWTGPVAPDVPIPVGAWSDSQRTIGWLPVGLSSDPRVEKAWSLTTAHGIGGHDRGSGSQGGRALYSSEMLAWRAARYERERAVAESLRRIDEEIARPEAVK